MICISAPPCRPSYPATSCWNLRAAELALRQGAELILLAVADDAAIRDDNLEAYAYSEHMVGPVAELLRRAAEKMLTAARERAVGKGLAVAHLELRSGDPAEQILAVAKEKEVGLVVLGRRGRSRMQGPVLGDVAYKVVCLALCDVLIARRRSRSKLVAGARTVER